MSDCSPETSLGDCSASDEFTAAFQKAYNIHSREVKDLRHSVQKLCAIGEQREGTIRTLKSSIRRMKGALKSARAKISKEVSLNKKLRAELQQYRISLPVNLDNDDVTYNSEGDDCIIVNQSPLSPSVIESTTDSMLPTTGTGVIDTSLVSGLDTSPAVCSVPSSPSVFEEDEDKTLSETQERPDDVIVSEVNGCGGPSECRVSEDEQDEHGLSQHTCSISESECVAAHYSLSRSSSPSPSLLHVPVTSWQLEQHHPQEEHAQDEQIERSKEVYQDLNMPVSDSQLSLNCLQTIPQSCELLTVTSASNRKRRCPSEDDSTRERIAIEDDMCAHSMQREESVPPTPPAAGISGTFTSGVAANRSPNDIRGVEPLTPPKKLKLTLRGKKHSTNDTSGNGLAAERNFSLQPKEDRGSRVQSKPSHNKGTQKECPQCRQWYSGYNETLRGQLGAGRTVCRHRYLPETDPRMWDISFPESEECNELLNRP